jgi:hypothetical protein
MIPALARCDGDEDAGCGALIDIRVGAEMISTGTRTGTASPPRRPLKRDPEKCEAVFQKDNAQTTS